MKKKFSPQRLKTFPGAVSIATVAGDFAFISGQISCDPTTGEVVHGSIEEETRLALQRIQLLVEDMGVSLEAVCRCDVFLSSMEYFDGMNNVYEEFFGIENPPARLAVAVELWGGMKVEISAIVKIK